VHLLGKKTTRDSHPFAFSLNLAGTVWFFWAKKRAGSLTRLTLSGDRLRCLGPKNSPGVSPFSLNLGTVWEAVWLQKTGQESISPSSCSLTQKTKQKKTGTLILSFILARTNNGPAVSHSPLFNLEPVWGGVWAQKKDAGVSPCSI